MANPQLEDGYTRIADEIMDALIRYRIPGEQMQCLLLIIRKTYGINKVWDAISNSQFVEFTKLNKSNVCRALRELIKKNIVVKKDNGYISSYCFNKRYQAWKVLSKKITVVKKDNKVLSKKTNTIDTITIDNNGFKTFYKAYPHKKDPKQAQKTWEKLTKKNELPNIEILLTAINNQIIERKYLIENEKFCPPWKNPSTWLNAGSWANEVKTVESDRKYDK